MNICHVITRLIIGGAQENTALTCKGLVERGCLRLGVVRTEVGDAVGGRVACEGGVGPVEVVAVQPGR